MPSRIDADRLAADMVEPLFGTRPDVDLAISLEHLRAVVKTAIEVVQAYDNVWCVEWPTEPGWYMFYCRTKTQARDPSHSPKTYFWSVQATRAGGESSPHMLYLGGGMILYPEEWEGVWQPFEREQPDLDAMLGTGDKR